MPLISHADHVPALKRDRELACLRRPSKRDRRVQMFDRELTDAERHLIGSHYRIGGAGLGQNAPSAVFIVHGTSSPETPQPSILTSARACGAWRAPPGE